MTPQPLARLSMFTRGGTSLLPWSSIWLPHQFIQNMPCCKAISSSYCHHDTQITIAVEGRPHHTRHFLICITLGKMKVDGWAQELNQLPSIATNNAFVAFTHGLSSKWTFLTRTILNISLLMQPLEVITHSELIPKLTGQCVPSDTERELFDLPTRLGGMCLINPSTLSQTEFHSSTLISQALVKQYLIS